MRKANLRLKRAYIAGLKQGQSTTPRRAYHKGFVSGKARANAIWTKKAAAQSEYYYKMGKGAH